MRRGAALRTPAVLQYPLAPRPLVLFAPPRGSPVRVPGRISVGTLEYRSGMRRPVQRHLRRAHVAPRRPLARRPPVHALHSFRLGSGRAAGGFTQRRKLGLRRVESRSVRCRRAIGSVGGANGRPSAVLRARRCLRSTPTWLPCMATERLHTRHLRVKSDGVLRVVDAIRRQARRVRVHFGLC